MSLDPLLSRADRQQVELRGECPKDIVSVLDAVSIARGITRTDLVNEVLGLYAKQAVREANSVHRVLRGNPAAAEAFGISLEAA